MMGWTDGVIMVVSLKHMAPHKLENKEEFNVLCSHNW